jgi:hypothetical protein
VLWWNQQTTPPFGFGWVVARPASPNTPATTQKDFSCDNNKTPEDPLWDRRSHDLPGICTIPAQSIRFAAGKNVCGGGKKGGNI